MQCDVFVFDENCLDICKMNFGSKKIISIWLWCGIIMVLIQMLLGAITRLTNSGLSITEWNIILGTFYPADEASWQHNFDLYKLTPQYQKINKGMNLDDFKVIFFWEYFHRLWARIMGFVFIIPFCFFAYKSYFNVKTKRNLFYVLLSAIFVASLGWIMVASGLINRPWVNAYKLAFHLCAALLLLLLLIKTLIIYLEDETFIFFKYKDTEIYKIYILFSLLLLQFFLGGVMSGMKAAIVAPTWPDINGRYFMLSHVIMPHIDSIVGDYDVNSNASLWIQFWHRGVAYLIYIYILYNLLSCYVRKLNNLRIWIFFFGLASIQVCLGVTTLLNSVGKVPLILGTLHQLGAICIIGVCFGYLYIMQLVGNRRKE